MRRFNYTGRLRIDRSRVSVTLHAVENGRLDCEADVDVSELVKAKVPPTAGIFLEAYNRTKFERFDLGTVGSPAAKQTWHLETFHKDESLLFRVKVVDANDHAGRIIASASGIRPATPDESHQSSLLPVSVEPLDDVVYRVDFPDDGPPTLRLNEALDTSLEGGIKAVVRTPLFVALVLPEVVRQVLTRILVVEGQDTDDDDSSSSCAKWRRYARILNPDPMPELGEEDDTGPLLEWIDVAVSKVGRDVGAIQRFQQAVAE